LITLTLPRREQGPALADERAIATVAAMIGEISGGVVNISVKAGRLAMMKPLFHDTDFRDFLDLSDTRGATCKRMRNRANVIEKARRGQAEARHRQRQTWSVTVTPSPCARRSCSRRCAIRDVVANASHSLGRCLWCQSAG